MQSIIKGILFIILLGFFTVAVAHEVPEREKFLWPIPDESWPTILLTALSAIWAALGERIAQSEHIRKSILAVLSAITVGSGFYYVEERAYISEHYITETLRDSVKVTVTDSVRVTTVIDTLELKKIQDAILGSLKARDGQLDSTIKAVQGSMDVHLNRHLGIIRADIDSLRVLPE